MAVMHMVWLKFRAEITETRIEEHYRALHGLKTRVPGVLELTVGRNFTDRASGYTHGVAVTLTDKVALAGYAVHPAHVEVAQGLRRDTDGVMALDYEF